jgi:hypothetical protein
MNTEFIGFSIEDINLHSDRDSWMDVEFYARELLDSNHYPMIGKKVDISNIYTSVPGIYKLQLLQKKQGPDQSVYHMIGFYKIILYPSQSFSIQMSLNQYNILETRLWVNRTEYLYCGIRTGGLVSVTVEYPYISQREKPQSEVVKSKLLSIHDKSLPELKKLVEGFKLSIELKRDKLSKLKNLVNFIYGLNLENLPGEGTQEYYSRLYNLFYCLYFNASITNLIRDDDLWRINSIMDEMCYGLNTYP